MDYKDLSLVHMSTFSAASFSLTIFICSCIHEKICPNFLWQICFQMHWLKNQFLCGKEKCHMRRFVCMHNPSQKTCHTLRGWQWLLLCPYCSQLLLVHGQTSFQHSHLLSFYTSKYLCHRKLATENLVVCTTLKCPLNY